MMNCLKFLLHIWGGFGGGGGWNVQIFEEKIPSIFSITILLINKVFSYTNVTYTLHFIRDVSDESW
jgi:hypothetical protein